MPRYVRFYNIFFVYFVRFSNIFVFIMSVFLFDQNYLTNTIFNGKIFPIKSHEGVASVYRNKSTYWPSGLACFKLRDSCIVKLYVESVYFYIYRV